MNQLKLVKFPGDDQFLSQIQAQLQAVDDVHYLAEASNMALDMMMAKVQRENKWADVCIVLEKVKIVLNKYQKNFEKTPAIYRLFWLRPSRLVQQIKNRFDSELVTRPFFKTLEYEKEDVRNYDWYCIFSLVFLGVTAIGTIASIVIPIIWHFYWILLLIPVIIGCCIAIFIAQDKFYKYAIQEIVFVDLFSKFVEAFQYREQQRREFIQKTYDIPQIIQERWQQSEMQKIFNALQEDEQEQLKTLQMKAAIRLQQLSATLALNQARNEEEINELRSKTRLRDLESELNIKDKVEAEKDKRRLAFHSIDASQQVLVAMASFLADKKMKDENVERLLTMLGGLKKNLRNSSDGFADVSFQEFIDDVLKDQAFPGKVVELD